MKLSDIDLDTPRFCPPPNFDDLVGNRRGAVQSLLRDRRFIVLGLLVALLCIMFWSSSRYPALDTKAQMAGDLNLEDQLSFDGWISHTDGESLFETVGITFLNWLHTNRQGMFFGITLAVILMSAMPVINYHLRRLHGGLSSSLAGFAVGVPLGVCVNCAAPIAFGLYRRGARAEFAIATMISSPVFNVIVISMLTTMFAWPLVAIKLGLSLLVVFLVVPLLLRLFPSEVYAHAVTGQHQASLPAEIPYNHNSILNALFWVGRMLLDNAIYLFVKVVPIMLFAGLIGTALVTFFPWSSLGIAQALVDRWEIVLGMALLAIFGLFLPVPVAFDVIISLTLINAGVPVVYVAVLLFTLGSFSVYSFMVLWKAGARKVASALTLALLVLGVVAGIASHYAMQWYEKLQEVQFYSMLQSDSLERHQIIAPVAGTQATPPVAVQFEQHASYTNMQTLQLGRDTSMQLPDWRMEPVADSGFLYHTKTLVEQMTLPFVQMNSLAAGDVNNDGWVDLVAGTSRGPFLYINIGGRYASIELPFQKGYQNPVGALGLIDFNNDGRLDLYFDQAFQASFISYNRGGKFDTPEKVGGGSQVSTTAVAFADLDSNGEIDIVEGYHSGANGFMVNPDFATNRFFLQRDGVFSGMKMRGSSAATLSILITDLEGAGRPDIYVGNDFDPPDVFYRLDSGGIPEEWQNKIATTHTTMSIDSADIDNDLRLETYHAQITRNPASPPAIIPEESLSSRTHAECGSVDTGAVQRNRCKSYQLRLNGVVRINNDRCALLPNLYQLDCLAAHWYHAGLRDQNRAGSMLLDKWFPDYAELYQRLLSDGAQGNDGNGMPQVKNRNLLYQGLSPESGGDLQEIAHQLGVDVTGWTWNARFADLDGDQWQDLFVANGWRGLRRDTTNLWFKNVDHGKFVQQTVAAGLEDYKPTLSSVYLDVDNDGDLDLVTFAIDGELVLYENNGNQNRHLQVELTDFQGNRSGIGSRVIITTDDGQSQVREVKASGGYQSQESAVLHFGLGASVTVEEIIVHWSNGGKDIFAGPFEGQQRIRILRPELQAQSGE